MSRLQSLRRVLQQYAQAELSLETLAAHQQRRWYALPDDVKGAVRRARFPARMPRAAPAPPGAGASSAPADSTAPAHAGAAGTARAGAGLAAMQHGSAKAITTWMFPWEKRQLQGGKLRWWEKLYWGAFAAAMILFAANRLPGFLQPKEPPKVDEVREGRKAGLARLLLAGRSLLGEGDDELFEGLSPKEIQAYVEEATGGASTSDPFEGMSPEEINAYVGRHGLGGGSEAAAGGAKAEAGDNGDREAAQAAVAMT